MKAAGIVYPADYFRPFLPDATFRAESEAFAERGVKIFTLDRSGLRPQPQSGQRYLYRGWMLSLTQYRQLYADWSRAGVLPLITPEDYALCHYLPNWYPLLQAWTPETHRIAFDEDLPTFLAALQAEGWSEFFLKDDVKSLKTGLGSRLNSPEQGARWLQEMRQFRPELEGGICIRRVEDWLPETEERWFVWQGQPFGPKCDSGQLKSPEAILLPDPVKAACEVINSPFFAVDVVQNKAGQWRLVELGDGQVSDLVGWLPEHFVELILS